MITSVILLPSKLPREGKGGLVDFLIASVRSCKDWATTIIAGGEDDGGHHILLSFLRAAGRGGGHSDLLAPRGGGDGPLFHSIIDYREPWGGIVWPMLS